MGIICITMKCFVVAVLLASAMAVQMEESTRMEVEASASMQVMTKLGLREVQEQVDKELWEARQAQASADDEDAEIARLLAELEGLDAEKNAAEKEAKQREVEAKEATRRGCRCDGQGESRGRGVRERCDSGHDRE